MKEKNCSKDLVENFCLEQKAICAVFLAAKNLKHIFIAKGYSTSERLPSEKKVY